jgi:uncharacterized protein YjdB
VVTWATSNSSVATVSSGGLVTAASPGSATITATSEGQSGAAAVTVTTVPVASVTVTPTSAGVTVGQTAQLAATPRDASGNPLTGRVVTWATSNSSVATVSSGGLVTAASPGSATITATSEGQRGTAAITVTMVPVASVTVTPASATVTVGQTAQFSAVVKDANGNILTGRTVTWTSDNAAVALVSASGLVTGLALGSATMTATSEGRSGTAALTVTSAGAGPEPGPTALIIFQDGFESGNLSQWSFQSDAGSGRYSVTTNAARVKSGTRSLETLYTPTNAYGMITRWFMPGYDEVYVKFSVLFEEGFQNKRPDGAGMHYFVLTGNNINDSRSSWGKPAIVPNGTDYFYAGLDPEENSLPTLQPFSYYTYWPDMSCCYGNMFYQQSPKAPLTPGQWQEVVFHVKLNTPGQSDGSQTVWINGVKKLDMQNMRWRTTTDLRLNEIRFDNYMGGGSPITEHVWLDDVTVWRP